MLKKPKIEHQSLRDGSALERMDFNPDERNAHLRKIREWYSKNSDFKSFFKKLEQSGFWNNLGRMPMPKLVRYMLEDRYFNGENEQLYLNKIKDILSPENSFIGKLKAETSKERRLEVIGREISNKLIDGEHLEAEILHMLYTAEFHDLKYLSD
ncbi:MAG: hypothetical protein V1672_05920 [Candidatus Diapherotrites archaeon]